MFKGSKKQKNWKRKLAGLMSCALVLANVYAFPVSADTPTDTDGGVVADVTGNDPVLQQPEMAVYATRAASASATSASAIAAGNTATFTAENISVPTGGADETPYSDGASIVTGDAYFIAAGSSLKYRNKNNGSVDTGSKESGNVQFTTEGGNATVTVNASSTGGSNRSALVLLDASGDPVEEDQKQVTLQGSDKKDFVWSNLEPGTYQIASPTGDHYTSLGGTLDTSVKENNITSRGARIYSITVAVAEGAAVTTDEYVFNASDLTVGNITSVTKCGTSDYFTLNASSGKKFTVDEKKRTFPGGIETTKRLKTGGDSSSAGRTIDFTVTAGKTANILVYAESSGGAAGEATKIALYDSNFTVVKGTETIIDGKEFKVIEWNDIPEGTYSIGMTKPAVDGTTVTEAKSGNFNYIKVTEIGSNSTPIQLTPTVTGTLPSGASVHLVKGAKSLAVTSGSAMTVNGSTKYDLVVKDASGNVLEDYRATVDGKTTYRTGDADGAVTITVSSAYVNPAVSLTADSLPADGNTITATAKGGGSVTLTPGSTAKLKIDETYTLTTSAAKTKALVNGKDSFTVTSDMSELALTIEPTVVVVPVKLFDENNIRGDVTELKLSNGKGDDHDLLAETTAELIIGDTYTLSYTIANEGSATVDGGTTMKVSKDTDAVKVLLTAKQEGLYNIDLTGDLKAGVEYDGGISVLKDMTYREESGYVQAPDGNPDPNKGAVPTSGAVLVLKAQQDGRLKIKLLSAGGKLIHFVDEAGGEKASFTSNADVVKTFAVEAGHTYYFYGDGTKVKLASVTVDYRAASAWDTIADPVLGTPTATMPGDADEGVINIPYKAQIGGVYADEMDIRVFLNGEFLSEETITIPEETDITNDYKGVAAYKPAKSGTYTFQALLKRSNEAAKESAVSAGVTFTLPMATPVIVNTENQGGGNLKFSWQEVPEATTYEVYMDGAKVAETADVFYRFTGLTPGSSHTFSVVAIGNGDTSEMTTSAPVTISTESVKNWQFAAFGQGVDTKNNKFTGSIDDNTLHLEGAGGKGKLVPASTDGLAFYYTTIDPATENFTLSADITVNEWTYSNGQEGFGLMAADRVGQNGDSSVFWNNSYMASVTKVEYFWDTVLNQVSTGGAKYSMKLGVGSQEKIGVSRDNLDDIQNGNLTDFKSVMTTLESYCGENGLESGTYNLVGNYTNDVDLGTVNGQTTFHLSIQRNNTGYFVSYTDAAGKTTTQKYYHGDDGDELTRLDPNNIYVGFFASRNAKIDIKNVQLDLIAPEDDAPAEERPISLVPVSAGFESAKEANSYNYQLVYYGNADGWLSIEQDGDIIVDRQPVTAETKYRFDTELRHTESTFKGIFEPDLNFRPSKYEMLEFYSAKEFSITVKRNLSEQNVYYVSPDSYGNGTEDSPANIYDVINRVNPGDTILLMEGTYDLGQTLTIERGIDGTPDQKIYMMADPKATSRPVLNFCGICAGMVMAGDYWYFQGFDVTGSANGQKGIQVSGSNNVLDNLHTYRNGNTGIQISRYKGTDLWEDWPANNLILNCTSYLNADAGYEDADGFAAKLTVADGNVFDGCIAAYNADDGWDLFAKIESGNIGVVTIRNCVTFKNGYVVDADGNEVNAGNGNGFKMGGSSMSGYHVLENSIAFANKAKGIDSNSCPDIQVYNSISYNNESYNVAFYTNDAKNTDFLGQGIISYKTINNEADNFKLRGLQDESKVRNSSNYYFNGSASTNGKATVDDSWFVSVDTDAAIHGGITRNADGTINMNGYLQLTGVAPEGVGANLEGAGTASGTLTIPEQVVPDDDDDEEETTGGESSGENASGGESSVPSADKVAEQLKDNGSAPKKPAGTKKPASAKEEPKTPATPKEDPKTAKEEPKGIKVSADNTVPGVKASEGAKFTDSKGNAIKDGAEIIIHMEELLTPSAEIQTAVDKLTEDVSDKSKLIVLYYDIKAYVNSVADENIVTLSDGTVMIKFDYPADVTKDNEIIALHEVEEVPVEKEDDCFWITADGFSPYTIIIKPVENASLGVSTGADITSPSVPGASPAVEEGGNSVLPIVLGIVGVIAVAAIIVLVMMNRKKEDEE